MKTTGTGGDGSDDVSLAVAFSSECSGERGGGVDEVVTKSEVGKEEVR